MLHELLNQYRHENYFKGNGKFFCDVISNPETIIFWDIDGILANTPKPVFKHYSTLAKRVVRPVDITDWDYLSKLALNDNVQNPESAWYDADVLSNATSYLFMRDAVKLMFTHQGAYNNFILTSREPYLKDSTLNWIDIMYPDFLPENVLIRTDNKYKPTEFKVDEIKRRATGAPYVVFIDDSTKYIKSALDADIPNLLAINIPLGKIEPDFNHERLVVIKRYPDQIQAMYPFKYAVEKAIDAY